MRTLILKLFKGVPEEVVDILLSRERGMRKMELEYQQYETASWKKKAVNCRIKLNNLAAEVKKMNIPRHLKNDLINKIKED